VTASHSTGENVLTQGYKKITAELRRFYLLDETRLERRAAARYNVRTSVEFGWGGAVYSGWLHDISVNGAFILSSCRPPVGAEIDVAIRFPGSSDIFPGMVIRSKAKVVRVEMDHQTGFAVLAKLDRLVRRGKIRSPRVPED